MEKLAKEKINSLWHFTDIRNLPLIRDLGGLRSKQYLADRGCFNKVYPGGNSTSHALDKRIGNWDKISLNFVPHTPMAYKKKPSLHLVFIEINPLIAAVEGVYFTDCNATRLRNGQNREIGSSGLDSVRFDIIHGPVRPWDGEWVKYVQAEVLVPDVVPIESFKAIHFVSEASLEFGKKLWGGGSCSTLFKVKERTFTDVDRSGQRVIQFPYVEKVIVTSDEVTKENCEKISTNDSYVRKGSGFWIIITLFSSAGTRGLVKLYPFNDTKDMVFDTQGHWFWWPSFRIDHYNGIMTLEVFLDDICWLKREIGVK